MVEATGTEGSVRVCTASINTGCWRDPSFDLTPFGLGHVFYFFFYPHLVGGLIINKSEILISEQGTWRHMHLLQETKTRSFPSGSMNKNPPAK